jgi:hypothetical protein
MRTATSRARLQTSVGARSVCLPQFVLDIAQLLRVWLADVIVSTRVVCSPWLSDGIRIGSPPCMSPLREFGRGDPSIDRIAKRKLNMLVDGEKLGYVLPLHLIAGQVG